MDKKIIKAEPRAAMSSRENRRQRAAGIVPASINIKGEDSVSVLVKSSELKNMLHKFGRAAVLQLKVGRKSYDVMVRDIDMQPHTDNYVHVVFQQVSKTEEIKVNVAISLKGVESLSLKQLNVSQQMDELTVSGLAADIPSAIGIDVSNLENGENFYVKDLKLPEGITVELDSEQLLLSVGMLRVYAEPEAEKAQEEHAEEPVQAE